MSDILFRYLLTARQRERSVIRRLFLADDPLLEAGVEQLVETAAARVGITSQHERVSQRNVTVPASQRRSVRFYDVPQPNRPQEGEFEQRAEEFPLSSTLKVHTCRRCRGSGRVRCGRCSGKGALKCARCRGSGRAPGGSGRRRTCMSCGGAGRHTCSQCNGSGRATCNQCRGEGRLASWQVEAYQWLIEYRTKDELPLKADAKRVRRAFNRWLDLCQEQVPSFEPGAVMAHLGFETSDAQEVATRADQLRIRLEKKAQNSNNRYLFHRTDRWIAPVGYTVVRLEGKARFYWLVGRGEDAREITPKGRPDTLKCLGWAGAGSGSVLSFETLALAYEQTLPVLESLQFFGDPSFLWLAGGSAASWALTLAGIHRVRSRKQPVPAVGLMFASGDSASFLTCLAYLGSYLGHLRVLDRAYDLQSQRLLGKMRPHRQSESLGLELTDGRRVRLVEIANPQGLSTERITLMVKALDAVMILESPDQPATDLRARLAQAAPDAKIATLAIDNAQKLEDRQATLPLEAIRRAFIEDLASNTDWQELFDQMWLPIAAVLPSIDDELRSRSAARTQHTLASGSAS